MVATSRAMLTTSGTLLNFKVKAVVYTCSPNYISVMSGLWRDVPHKISHKVTTTGKDILLYFALPLFAVTSYAADYKEREKMRHRF